MILGRGDIASVLHDRDGYIFFASGVSNSQEDREKEYDREKTLLLKQDQEMHLVYFSSLSIFYADGRYQQHKMEMEALVRENFKTYTIVRIGNISWGNNPHTIINYLRNKIQKRDRVRIDDVYRYIVDQEEFMHWVEMIPDWSCEINIPGRRMKVSQIVEEYGNT